MSAKEAAADTRGPRAGSMAPSVTPAPAEATLLGVAQVDPEAEAEAQTRPDALADEVPVAPSAIVEALPPPAEDEEEDSSPFPTLEAAMAQVLADPLEPTVSGDTDATPPPLPGEPHLRVVSEPAPKIEAPEALTEAPEPAEAAEAEPARPRGQRPGRGPTRPRTGSRPAVRTHTRSREEASDSSGRAFGTNPPRGPTPPPVAQDALRSQLDDWTPPLRREESVLEEAEALRHRNLYRIRRFFAGLGAKSPALADLAVRARTAAARGRTQLSQGGLRLASRIGTSSISALHQFEKLPRRRQVLYAVAPYGVALVLVLVLLAVRGGDEAEPPVTPLVPAPEAAGLVEAPEAAAPVVVAEAEAAEAPAEPTADAAPEAPAPAAEPIADAAPAVADATLPTEARVLPRRSRLFVRADPKSRRPIRLRKGTELTIYPTFPAPEGWQLVQTKKGTVGFVSALHLEGKADPRVDRRRRGRRRR